MSGVKILFREIPAREVQPGVHVEVKDPKRTTEPVEHPAPLVQIGAQPRRVHYAPPGRYAPAPSYPAPQIMTASPIPLYIGPAVDVQFDATGDGPLTWSAQGLPAGLSISNDGLLTGQLVGKPLVSAPAVINLYEGSTSGAIIGGIYGTPPYTLQASGLPAGASLVNNDAISVGSNVALGSYPFTITITDANGDTSSLDVTLNVSSYGTAPGTAVDGGVYDINDLSTLFVDTGASQPAAVGDHVGLVKDKSGNGHDLIQPSSGSAPVLAQDSNGRYYLQFNGGQFLNGGSAALDIGTSSLAGMAGVRFDSSAYGQAIYAKSLAGSLSGRYWLNRIGSGSYLSAGFQDGGSVYQPKVADTSTAVRVISQVIDRQGGGEQIRVHGSTPIASNSAADSTDLSAGTRFLVGAYNNSSDGGEIQFLTGRIYFLSVWMLSAVDYNALAANEDALASAIGAA